MSEDNNKGNAPQNLLTTLRTNPKALVALLVAVAVVALAIAMSGGGEQVRVNAAVAVGQTVTLENPNGGSSHLTVGPGLMTASGAEEDKEQSVCVVKAGVKATVEEEQVVGLCPTSR